MRTMSKSNELKTKKKLIGKTIYWGALGIIIFYTLFLTRHNIFVHWQQKREYRMIIQNLESIRHHNSDLRHQINELRNNPEAIERIARNIYRMKRENEIVIEFKNPE